MQETRHLHTKTTSVKLYINMEMGARDLYIDKAHTALDIFRFTAFSVENQILDKNNISATLPPPSTLQNQSIVNNTEKSSVFVTLFVSL